MSDEKEVEKKRATYKEVGRGTYGIVYRNPDNTVTKCMRLYHVDKSGVYNLYEAALREICFVSSYGHSFTLPASGIRYVSGYAKVSDKICFKMPEYKYNVHHWVEDHCLQERLKIIPRLIFCVVSVLIDLDKYKLSHGDIKPSNILFDEKTNDVRLIDWGSMLHFRDQLNDENQTITEQYAPPEHLLHGTVNAAADVFSLGMSIRHIINKTYLTKTDILNYHNDEAKYIPLLEEETEAEIPEEANRLLCKYQKLLLLDNEKRPTLQEIYQWSELEGFRNDYKQVEGHLHISDGSSLCNWEKFTNISILSRECVAEWIFRICCIREYGMSIFVHSIWLLDSYMNKQASYFPKMSLNLVAISCFALARSLSGFVYLDGLFRKTSNYDSEDIVEMVWSIALCLEYKLFVKSFTESLDDNKEIDVQIIKYIMICSEYVSKTAEEKRAIYYELQGKSLDFTKIKHAEIRERFIEAETR